MSWAVLGEIFGATRVVVIDVPVLQLGDEAVVKDLPLMRKADTNGRAIIPELPALSRSILAETMVMHPYIPFCVAPDSC